MRHLQDYGADFEVLQRVAYPDAPMQFTHQLAMSRFIDGVCDIQLHQAFRLGRFAKIKNAN